jgi:hypothetical protein
LTPLGALLPLDAGWTAREDDSPVLVTLVVRLLPERLADGEFVGEVEHVGRGGQAVVREISDLVGFAQRAAASEPAGDSVTGNDAGESAHS